MRAIEIRQATGSGASRAAVRSRAPAPLAHRGGRVHAARAQQEGPEPVRQSEEMPPPVRERLLATFARNRSPVLPKAPRSDCARERPGVPDALHDNGKTAQDQTTVGLVFSDAPRPRDPGDTFMNRSMMIPAGAAIIKSTPTSRCRRRESMGNLSAHAPARQGVEVRKRYIQTAGARSCCQCRATIQRRPIRTRDAADAAEGTKLIATGTMTIGDESDNRITSRRALGRSDGGRDAVHGLLVSFVHPARTTARAFSKPVTA